MEDEFEADEETDMIWLCISEAPPSESRMGLLGYDEEPRTLDEDTDEPLEETKLLSENSVFCEERFLFGGIAIGVDVAEGVRLLLGESS